MKYRIEDLFSRRAFLLGAGQGILLSTLVGRLYYLQILSGEHYKTLSDKNRIHARLLVPPRGQILDYRGEILATNRKAFNALAIRAQTEDWDAMLLKIAPLLNLEATDLERLAREAKQRTKFIPTLLKQNLDWEEVARLELHLPELPGVFIEEGQSRYYHETLATSHVIGYVAVPSEAEAKDQPVLMLPQMRIGKTGIEKHLDESLRGQAGALQQEVDAKRQVIRDLSMLPGQSGTEVQLTLDLNLQKKAYELLAPYESGAVAVLDCHTGAVRALISYPGFDSNLFVDGISHNHWQELLYHPRRALIPKAIAGQYPPGSTFKMIVALAALKAKVIDAHTSVTCNGYVDLGNHRFHCWQKGAHGPVDLGVALARSCDIYFYQVAARLGVDAIADMAKKFGLGMTTGIDIPGEKSGLIPSKSWKSKIFGQSWTLGETYNTGIGQGYLLATPLQLAVMAAALANGGKLVTPYLFQPLAEPQSIGISPQDLALVQEGLFRCVNEAGGTGFASRITDPHYIMAGKTGSSQVRRITLDERKRGLINSNNRPWGHREHGLFVGYAPFHKPRFAACVLLEHAVSGKHAVPIVRDLLLQIQQQFPETSDA